VAPGEPPPLGASTELSALAHEPSANPHHGPVFYLPTRCAEALPERVEFGPWVNTQAEIEMASTAGALVEAICGQRSCVGKHALTAAGPDSQAITTRHPQRRTKTPQLGGKSPRKFAPLLSVGLSVGRRL
jgi:hypothetical protein